MTNKLYTHDDNGTYSFHKPVDKDTIVNIANNILAERFQRGSAITSPKEAVEYLTLRLGILEREVFLAMFLDNRHRVIATDILFMGTINGASIHPREIVKQALAHNAAAIIVSHNHPSGLPEPSASDIGITQKIKDALELVDIKLLDHIVVAGTQSVSLIRTRNISSSFSRHNLVAAFL